VPFVLARADDFVPGRISSLLRVFFFIPFRDTPSHGFLRGSERGLGESQSELKKKLRLVTRFVKMTIITRLGKQRFERLASESFPKFVNRQIMPHGCYVLSAYVKATYENLSRCRTI